MLGTTLLVFFMLIQFLADWPSTFSSLKKFAVVLVLRLPFDIAVVIFAAGRSRDLWKSFVLWGFIALSFFAISFWAVVAHWVPDIFPDKEAWVYGAFLEICVLSIFNILFYKTIFDLVVGRLKPKPPSVFPELRNELNTEPPNLVVKHIVAGEKTRETVNTISYMKKRWESWFRDECSGRLRIYKRWSIVASTIEGVHNELVRLCAIGWKRGKTLTPYLGFALDALTQIQHSEFAPPGLEGQLRILLEEMPPDVPRPDQTNVSQIITATNNLELFATGLLVRDDVPKKVVLGFCRQVHEAKERLSAYFSFNLEDPNWRPPHKYD